MKPPDQVKIEFTCQWVRKAESDFRTAGRLLEGGTEFLVGAAFHAQQAAEKYLKSFLVWRQIEFSKTHDIGVLLALAAGADPAIPVVLSDAASLTPYGVEYRYPGDYPDVTMAAAGEAVHLAERVRSEIRKHLPPDVLG